MKQISGGTRTWVTQEGQDKQEIQTQSPNSESIHAETGLRF